MQSPYFTAIKAGAAYFFMVFALGFVLGTIRVLWLVPNIGEMAAVLAEQPVMLTASWFAARCLVRRQNILRPRARLVMGTFAFAMLMIAELTLAVSLFGETPRQWMEAVMTVPGSIGLMGQVVFALIPLFSPRASSRPPA
jgi:hypothetical protein